MADDYGGSATTGGAAFVLAPIRGEIEAATDEDWFKIILNAGATYTFDLEGADTGQGALADPRIRLLNIDGVQVAGDDNSGVGANAQLVYTPLTTGTYFLSAQSASAATGDYRLLVSATGAPADDYAVGAGTLGSVSIGAPATGAIESGGDVDWFRVDLSAGQTYIFGLEGAGGGALGDPTLQLLDGVGSTLAADDDSGPGYNSQIVFSPVASGAYYLAAEAYSSMETGGYRISVSNASVEDAAGSGTPTAAPPGASGMGAAAPMQVGTPAAGNIEAGEVDWVRLDLSAGQTYVFDLKGADTGSGSLSDPRLSLFNGAGALLATDDDTGVGHNAQLIFTPRASGAYYLAAQAYASTASGSYQLATAGVGNGVQPILQASYLNIMRTAPAGPDAAFLDSLANQVAAGTLAKAGAFAQLVGRALNTTTVATLSYEFFTGRIPSQAGLDYLVSPTGPNPNNLNSAYYQSYSIENRYIDFAVNLGKAGEGAAGFGARYGGLSLFEATRAAYQTIFGGTPTEAKIHELLDTASALNGKVMSRSDYFAYYGQDGPNGIGAKAAMVGWLLAEAAKADVGLYARSNHAFLLDLADEATFGVDLVGVYGKPEYSYSG